MAGEQVVAKMMALKTMLGKVKVNVGIKAFLPWVPSSGRNNQNPN